MKFPANLNLKGHQFLLTLYMFPSQFANIFFDIPNICHKSTSLKSRIALQVARKITPCDSSGGSSISQNKLPQLILGYIYILKYLQSNFIG